MPDRLYNHDAYTHEFRTKVVQLEDPTTVILEQTAFFPEHGGQCSDVGTIGGINVVRTEIKNAEKTMVNGYEISTGGTIVHVLEKPANFRPNEMVACEIDWNHRYRTMRLHSASHIMEHYLTKKFPNIERVGSFVNADKDRSDYMSDARFENADLLEVAEATNNFITQEKDIILDGSSGVIIWRCGDIVMPCCGTHVKNTREIGLIKLKRVNKGKGLERVVTSLITP